MSTSSSSFHPARVHTRSGYRADEQPREFRLRGELHRVREVLERTREIRGDGGLRETFRVITETDQEFRLRHHPVSRRWFAARLR